jgi:hypothetical protein
MSGVYLSLSSSIPSFSAFGKDFFIHRFTKLEGNKVLSEFLRQTSGRVEMAAETRQCTSEQDERAAINGEMKLQVWKKIFATPDALSEMGAAFWQPCHEHQPFAVFIAQKNRCSWSVKTPPGTTSLLAINPLQKAAIDSPPRLTRDSRSVRPTMFSRDCRPTSARRASPARYPRSLRACEMSDPWPVWTIPTAQPAPDRSADHKKWTSIMLTETHTLEMALA